jgi:hypothetical protein
MPPTGISDTAAMAVQMSACSRRIQGCNLRSLIGPNPLRLHCRCTRVLHFEPMGRAAGTVDRVLTFRHDTFESHLAGVAKYGLAVALHVLVEANARSGLGQDHFEGGLADLQRIAPQIVTVQLVEGIEKDVFV